MTNSDPGVRPAVLSDADAIFTLLRKFVTSYEPLRPEFDRNYPRLLGDGQGADLLVAERDGLTVGYVLASDSLTLFANGVVTELIELYVDEGYRRRGIGRELVLEAITRARDQGAVEITVPTRRARSFYLGLGFESTAEFFKLRVGDSAEGA